MTEVNEVRIKIEKIIREAEIPKYKAVEVFYMLGVTYYKLGEYDKALKMIYNTDKTRYGYVYIGHIQRKQGVEVSIPEYSEEELSVFPKGVRLMYEYFKNVDKIPEKESQRYIMKVIEPALNKKDDNLVNIMKEELMMLADNTKRYKDLLIFDKKVEFAKTHDE